MSVSKRSLDASGSVRAKIWWSNSIFFVATHTAAAVGVYYKPPWAVHKATLVLAFVIWQAACFGITIGYHRLFSHRAFRAAFPVRVVLAALGLMAFQGSIKWWSLRHRLHHRFTDDPVHDPYAATRGLLYSHMGWIFFKPTYERLEQVDREDLDSDPVVRFQHKYYVPLALSLGLILPLVLGWTWNDSVGAFVWGGLASRLMIWHCTFLVNSLAHWEGLQPYSDEDSSRGNLVMALLTCGEGNHNFHTFPHDFRSGPSPLDWDPSKWIILALHRLGLVTGLRRAQEDDILSALVWMRNKGHGIAANHSSPSSSELSEFYSSTEEEDDCESDQCTHAGGGFYLPCMPTWEEQQLANYLKERSGRCVVIIDNYAVNVTGYLGEHPGGASILRKYSYSVEGPSNATANPSRDATWAFYEGLNNHSKAAKRRMRQLRVARVSVQGNEYTANE